MLSKNEFEKLFLDIKGNSLVGKDVRYDDDFITIEEEIQKLSSVIDINSIDYGKIEKYSAKILIEKSKDISVACYLSYSLLIKGNDSLIQAITLISIFIDKYWTTAFPPISRLKARVNIISWWFLKVELFFNTINNFDFNIEQRKELISVISNLDGILKMNMKDNYCLNLLSLKEKLEVKSEKKKDEVFAQDNNLHQKSVENISKEILEKANIKEIKELCKESLRNYKELLNYLFIEGIYSSELFIINRVEIWKDLLQLPVNDNKITMLSEPKEHHVNYLENLFENKDWDELLKEAEGLIDEHIFWLDPHFYVSTALENLNKKEEQKCVELILCNFLERIGNIQDYKFKDKKTPFASKRTIKWLKDIQNKDFLNFNDSIPKLKVSTFNWCINDYTLNNNKKIGDLL